MSKLRFKSLDATCGFAAYYFVAALLAAHKTGGRSEQRPLRTSSSPPVFRRSENTAEANGVTIICNSQ